MVKILEEGLRLIMDLFNFILDLVFWVVISLGVHFWITLVEVIINSSLLQFGIDSCWRSLLRQGYVSLVHVSNLDKVKP